MSRLEHHSVGISSVGIRVGRSVGRRAGWILCTIAVSAIWCGACSEPSKGKAEEVIPRRGSFSKAEGDQTKLPARDLDAESLQNMASLLAGSVGSGAKLSPAWVKHQVAMDELWTRIGPRLDAMSTWSRSELVRLPASEAPVFYPFGGPDLFALLNLFPDASSFILVGLEAPGRLPMPEDTDKASLENDLMRLRRPFESMAEAGYFVRTQIDQELSGGHFDGLLPILLVALARAGQVPEAVQYVRLDASGQLVGIESNATTASAVRILFRPAGDKTRIRSVFYYAQDLSNDGVFPDSGFYHMIEKLGTINVFIKSGEYLLHTDPFSNLRKLVLERSQIVLQDDSGVPLRFFTSDRWLVELYGHYEDVLAAYKPWFQPDLAAAYQHQDQILPLPFAAGYQTAVSGGCLILANRKAAAGPKRRGMEP